MECERTSKVAAEAAREQERRALLDEELAFDAWLESYQDANEAGGEGV